VGSLVSQSNRTPRLLLKLRTGLKRLDQRRRAGLQPMPQDRAWHEMLARLDADEAERRLDAMTDALNKARRN